MGRRGWLILVGSAFIGVAVIAGLVVFNLAQGGGFGSGPDPVLDFLVWFAPIMGFLGVALLVAGAFTVGKGNVDPPYRPLDR